MQAVILAGGRGERLRPLTDYVPKPMVDIDGKPFLQYQLEFLRELKIMDVLLLTGYLGHVVSDHFGDGRSFGLSLVYSREPAPLGTGGALKHAASQIRGHFLLLNGDTFLPIDYRLLEASLLTHATVAGVMAVCSNEGAMAAKNLAVDGAGRVIAYSRRDSRGMTHVDAGAIVFRPEVLDLIPTEGFCSLEDMVNEPLIRRGQLEAYVSPEPYFDIGTPARLERFRRYLRDHR